MFDLSDIDKLICQQKKYFTIERVFCYVLGGLLAGMGILTFFFLNHIAGVLLFAAGATFLFWAKREKKLSQLILANLHTLRTSRLTEK